MISLTFLVPRLTAVPDILPAGVNLPVEVMLSPMKVGLLTSPTGVKLPVEVIRSPVNVGLLTSPAGVVVTVPDIVFSTVPSALLISIL